MHEPAAVRMREALGDLFGDSCGLGIRERRAALDQVVE